MTQMRVHRKLALGAAMLAVVLAACSSGGGSKPTIKIGSDGFYEAKLMAEIYAQTLEANGYTVNRDGIGLGTRQVTAAALDSGQIDLKPEYLGGGTAFYAPGKQTGDSAANAKELQTVLTPKNITVLGYTPAQDQNAFVVRKETADQFKLSKMSDLTAVASQLKFGVATDCDKNPVCGEALKSAYGIDVANATKLSACDTPMAQALIGKTIDVGELCSTQPDIAVNNLVVLEDDKHTQPAENIAPLVRNDFLAKTDKAAFQKLLDDVSAKMDTPTLTELGKQIAVDKKDVAAVAKQWLKDKGVVK
jgi:osmoprotectant transport system substrate-binding protein